MNLRRYEASCIALWNDTNAETPNTWIGLSELERPDHWASLPAGLGPLSSCDQFSNSPAECFGRKGWQLFSIGPRGGGNPLWQETNSELIRPTGIDMGENGNLCIADRGAQQMLELAPDENSIPDNVLRRIDHLDIMGCQYASDGIWLLLDNPRRVEILADDNSPVPDAQDLPDGTLDLLKGNGTDVSIFVADADLRGIDLGSGLRFEFHNGDLIDDDGFQFNLTGSQFARVEQRSDGSWIVTFS
jgi:hypothetical protein